MNDLVVKNHINWTPNVFDDWGRGVGVGKVLAIEPDIDVRWPEGRCYEDSSQILIEMGPVSKKAIWLKSGMALNGADIRFTIPESDFGEKEFTTSEIRMYVGNRFERTIAKIKCSQCETFH